MRETVALESWSAVNARPWGVRTKALSTWVRLRDPSSWIGERVVEDEGHQPSQQPDDGHADMTLKVDVRELRVLVVRERPENLFREQGKHSPLVTSPSAVQSRREPSRRSGPRRA